MTPEDADRAQAWLGMDGATALHLIDRHADNWNEAGEMMNAWLRANVRTERKACATTAESAVLDAARKWWEGNRPCGWTQAQHIAQPCVNAGGSDCSLRLAAAVGHLVEMERVERGNVVVQGREPASQAKRPSGTEGSTT